MKKGKGEKAEEEDKTKQKKEGEGEKLRSNDELVRATREKKYKKNKTEKTN